MAKAKKKQSAKQKRILIASIVIAAAITVGGTFAWFTSTDSVTNRLTASADYGVSITEDFTPPKNWVPGQAIDKAVGAVNTGSVSAFVKLSLSNTLEVTYETLSEEVNASTGASITLPNESETVKNVKLNGDGKETSDGAKTDDSPDEVLAAKAGGVLVYTTNETDSSKAVTVDSVEGVGTEFAPSGAGLYIFRRDISSNATSTESYTYDGFYYDGTDYYKIDSITPTFDETNTTTITSVKFKFVTETTTTKTPTLAYESDKNRVVATYAGTDTSSDNKDADDIVIYINLDKSASSNWQNKTGTSDFYLKSILIPGATSADLVKSVELAGTTQTGAYKNFVYDLDIDLTSVQAVYDNDGNISNDDNSITYSQTAAATIDGNNSSITAEVTANSPADKSGTVTWTLS